MPVLFGDVIRDARKRKNLSQLKLAEAVGATNTSVSNWEQNLNKPDADTLEQICYVLEISPNDLFQTKKSHSLMTAASTKERELLTLFRQLDESDQTAALNMLSGLAGSFTRPVSMAASEGFTPEQATNAYNFIQEFERRAEAVKRKKK